MFRLRSRYIPDWPSSRAVKRCVSRGQITSATPTLEDLSERTVETDAEMGPFCPFRLEVGSWCCQRQPSLLHPWATQMAAGLPHRGGYTRCVPRATSYSASPSSSANSAQYIRYRRARSIKARRPPSSSSQTDLRIFGFSILPLV